MSVSVWGVTAMTFLLAGAEGAIPPLEPQRLRTEQRHDEPCLTAPPRLSWWAVGPGKGRNQTAYRILVATRKELLAGEQSDLWDSGKVASEQCHLVPCAGKAAAALGEAWWTVRLWDEAGRPSAWAGPRRWFIGPREEKDWTGAKWIAGDPKAKHGGGRTDEWKPLPILRKGFRLDKPVQRATAYVSGLGYYDLLVNGQRAGNFGFAPAWTEYGKRVSYQAHDVTAMLKPGPNALGAMLGNGFYNVPAGRYAKLRRSDGCPKLIVLLHIEHADGSSTSVVSDGSWRWTEGPILFSCIYGGEDHDARREPAGWSQAGFDDAKWLSATVVDGPKGELVPQAVPAVVVTDEFPAKPVDAAAKGSSASGEKLILDAVQTTNGWPWIKVRGETGAKIVIEYNERGPGGGTGGSSFSYILRGGGEEAWHPRFSHTSLRGLAIQRIPAKPGGPLPELIEAKVQALRLDVPEASGFSSSDETLNKIHRRIDWSIRSNLSYVLTDCPHREILGWLEVLQLMAPSILYRYDAACFYAKTAQDMVDVQGAGGQVPTVAPAYARFGGAFGDSPEWGGAVVLAPAWSRLFTADARPVEVNRGAMVRWCDYLTGIAAKNDGAVKYGLNDWGNPAGGKRGGGMPVPHGLTGTWVLYQCLKTVAAVDREAGRTAEATALEERAASVFADFQRLYWKPEPGTYGGDDQTSLGIALAGGLTPPELRAKVAARLVALVASDTRIRTGEIGLPFLLRALNDAGRSDLVFGIIMDAYGKQAGGLGQTSLCEFWNGGGTANHCMMGHGMEWLYGSLAGICPDADAPGFARAIIKPHPVAGLEWVEARHDSPHGRIGVKWRQHSGQLELAVTVPPGVKAKILVPAADAMKVTCDGAAASKPEEGRAVFRVDSGEWAFQSALPK